MAMSHILEKLIEDTDRILNGTDPLQALILLLITIVLFLIILLILGMCCCCCCWCCKKKRNPQIIVQTPTMMPQGYGPNYLQPPQNLAYSSSPQMNHPSFHIQTSNVPLNN